MDVEKLDASWERAKARWSRVKRGWQAVKHGFDATLAALALPVFLPVFLGLIVWLIWDLVAHTDSRHKFVLAEYSQLKWYLGFLVASWVIGKVWRKKPKLPVESDDGLLHKEDVQGSEQEDQQGSERKDRGRKHRRVQRGG